MSYDICVNCYEGPMDLLLDLVSKKKIDIYDISISQITKQYLESISDFENMNMELASDFIYMASRLLEIKSRYMLYIGIDEEIEDPRTELFESIKEYGKYKNAAYTLRDLALSSPMLYYKPSIEIYYEEIIDLSNITLDNLISKFPKSKQIEKEKTIQFSRKIISIEDKINQIKTMLDEKTSIYFDEISCELLKEDQVASMLGILELAKAKEACLSQYNHLERIHIKRWEDIG